MSVKARIGDAQVLYQANRGQGALLSVLVGVAATSRKRRPAPTKDSDAFIMLLREEILVVTGGGVVNYWVRFRDQKMRLEQFLYKFVRCELAHEARLPEDVRFVPQDRPGNLSVQVTDSGITMSDTWMDGLSKVVRFAPENAEDSPDVGEMPEDVIKWMLFGRRRDGPHVPRYWVARQAFAEAWASARTARESETREVSKSKQRTNDQTLREYRHAYERWTWVEDMQLEEGHESGKPIAELAEELQKQPSAIRSRLKELGLLDG